MSLPRDDVLHKVVLGLCRYFDDSKRWKDLVPGAANALQVDMQVFRAANDGLPRIDVFDAKILQTFESNNAVLPFVTVPFIGGGVMTREVKVMEKKWHWTFERLSAPPVAGIAYNAAWLLRDHKDGEPLARVRFYTNSQGRIRYEGTPARALPALPAYGSEDVTPTRQPRSIPVTQRDEPDDREALPGFHSIQHSDTVSSSATVVPSSAGATLLSDDGWSPTPHDKSQPRPGAMLTGTERRAPIRDDFAHVRPAYDDEPAGPYKVGRKGGYPRSPIVNKRDYGWQRRIERFLGQIASESAPQYRLAQDGLVQVVEITVEMDGIWQSASPQYPMGHARGNVFGPGRGQLPTFALPGAPLGPKRSDAIVVEDSSLRKRQLLSRHKNYRCLWVLTSRAGRPADEYFEGAHTPCKTTWTCTTSASRRAKEPTMVAHFVQPSVYVPVGRHRVGVATEIFSLRHRGSPSAGGSHQRVSVL
ncbi:hypothetical protein JCM10908_005724 [Rhodotorula pacifica]|uniref:uncharacterized protein n=1 Tax=Rhodotorula pacifica TaxID=1495444 RepID=UPI003173EFA7